MFGYLVANSNALDEAESERYHAAYCGLCRTLADRHGQRARMGLTYDMVFLVLLMGSLYEPEETSSSTRCAIHPLKLHPTLTTDVDEYAADITVALSYHKALDDWNDERSKRARTWAAAIRGAYRRAETSIPVQCMSIENGLSELGSMEAASKPDPDGAAAVFGSIMADIFAPRDDEWSRALRAFGDRLGRFIYLMDALCDMEEDARKGTYNPLLAAGISRSEAMEPITAHIGGATEIFEKLPLERDLHLMRSVLYSGVWHKYNLLIEREKRRANRKGDDAVGGVANPIQAQDKAEQDRE